MKVTDIDLGKMLQFNPDTGRLLLGADRMLLFRQDAFASLRKLMFDQLGGELARALFSQFGYRCGYGDFEVLKNTYKWDTEQDQFAAGPVMHTWEGIVQATPTALEFDRKTKHFNVKGIWKNSYEAEIHMADQGMSQESVCHSLAGYASGWCTAFIGAECVCVEALCVAKGDPHCTFDVRRVDVWGPEAKPWQDSLALTDVSMSRQLQDKIAELERHRQATLELSTPIIQIWEGVVALPLIGVVDSRRSALITEKLLGKVAQQEIKCVLLDLTGVDMVDTRTADNFIKTARALTLVGSRCIITGIRPEVAQTLTQLGVDMSGIVTVRSLKEGLEESLRLLGYTVRKAATV